MSTFSSTVNSGASYVVKDVWQPFIRPNAGERELVRTSYAATIGIAITFFDDNGNQVGSEIIHVNNARPDVPYPFTSTIDMALNRAFSSSSTYVLYADPAEVIEEP